MSKTASKDTASIPLPRVSVVMAAYNYAQYIAQAIESVQKQTFTDWELIIVDDGSTDNTEDIVRPFLADRRIRYHKQENGGQPKAENQGVNLARAELIAFLDADDAWLPEKLEKQIPLFKNRPEVGVVYTGLYVMDENGIVDHGTAYCKRLRGSLLKESLITTIPPFSSSMVRRCVFDEVGFFNEAFAIVVDYDFWIRTATRYEFDYVDAPLLQYRTGHTNLSTQYKRRRKFIVNTVLPHVIENCGVNKILSRRDIVESYAWLFSGFGERSLSQSQFSAIRYQLRAIAKAPWLFLPWKRLLRALIPNPVAQMVKRIIAK